MAGLQQCSKGCSAVAQTQRSNQNSMPRRDVQRTKQNRHQKKMRRPLRRCKQPSGNQPSGKHRAPHCLLQTPRPSQGRRPSSSGARATTDPQGSSSVAIALRGGRRMSRALGLRQLGCRREKEWKTRCWRVTGAMRCSLSSVFAIFLCLQRRPGGHAPVLACRSFNAQ